MATETHVLAIPCPLQGHINPMVQLCKCLTTKGIRTTVVTTVSTSEKLRKQAGGANQIINIETVPDFVVQEHDLYLDAYGVFMESFKCAITRGLPEIIQKHICLKAVVYDSVLPWALDMAHGHGLKGAVFFTQPCTVGSVYYHLHKGTLDIPRGEASEVSLPGMPVMQLKDLPTAVYDSKLASLLQICIEQFSTFGKADWRLFNTFDKLEEEILKWMAKQYPILTVGPTIPLQLPAGDRDYGLSLFKPNAELCMKWLDAKSDHSVVYVSFGSLVNIGEEQMNELLNGLINSQCNFLLVFRDYSEEENLTSELSKEKGLIVRWCPQLEVLSHRAVGCFVTHCGWNSTLEALSLGVPMVAMPRRMDQTTNAKLIVDVWGAGVSVQTDENGIVSSEQVASRVSEVMRDDMIRRNALKWKDLAVEAVSEGGSSWKNLAEFATCIR